mgnify:CR=1 FL=1
MSEWDWDANAELDPNKLTSGSNKKAWWKCSKCGYCFLQGICPQDGMVYQQLSYSRGS